MIACGRHPHSSQESARTCWIKWLKKKIRQANAPDLFPWVNFPPFLDVILPSGRTVREANKDCEIILLNFLAIKEKK